MADIFTGISDQVDVSVVIATYNRSHLIRGAVESVLRQQSSAGAVFEILVVDNNSTDGTKGVVNSLMREHQGCLRYLFEPRQGVSHARNRGVAAARAPVVAFMDDDVRAGPGWIGAIRAVFDQHPYVSLAGGKVLPDWRLPAPRWLTRHHWMPLALLDYGDVPIRIDVSTRIGLISANCALRKDVLVRAGGFAPALQRVRDGIGSMEDHELFERLFRAGACGLYWPQLQVTAVTAPERLTRAYHRRWHFEHGRFYAVYRSRSVEETATGRLFDVPAHLYRQMAVDAMKWLECIVSLKTSEAFAYENRLRFFAGFFSKRLRQYLDTSGAGDRRTSWRSPAP